MQTNQMPVRRRSDPRLVNATLLIVQAVLSKEIAANVDEPLKGSIIKSADSTISFIADEFCGTATSPHTKRPPRPMPGPRGLGLELAIAVATFANVGGKSESLRIELMKVAGNLTQKAFEHSGLR
jgi:hypothetical protein